jgi:hypothetical protein
MLIPCAVEAFAFDTNHIDEVTNIFYAEHWMDY